MKEPVKLPFSNSTIHRIVCAAFPGAKSRRPVKVECRTSYHVADYWDGGSRNYCAFVRLSDMSALSSDSIPRSERQQNGNAYNLPIADVEIQNGFCVVENCIFCGKNLGYRIFINSEGIKQYLPEASEALPLPEATPICGQLTD
jgi:hypothetical protein